MRGTMTPKDNLVLHLRNLEWARREAERVRPGTPLRAALDAWVHHVESVVEEARRMVGNDEGAKP